MSTHTTYINPGRPCELRKSDLAQLKVFYKNNIPAVDAARHFKLSRQRVYYYYNKFKYDPSITRHYRPSIADLTTTEATI